MPRPGHHPWSGHPNNIWENNITSNFENLNLRYNLFDAHLFWVVYRDRNPWWKETELWRLFKWNLKLVHVGTESGILLTMDHVAGTKFNGLFSITQNNPWRSFIVTTNMVLINQISCSCIFQSTLCLHKTTKVFNIVMPFIHQYLKNIGINSTITNLCLLVPSHSNGWSASETLAFSPKAATAASNPRASSVGNRNDGLSSWHLGSRPTVAEDIYPVVRSLMTKPLGHLIHLILSFLQIKSQETPKDIQIHLQNGTI